MVRAMSFRSKNSRPYYLFNDGIEVAMHNLLFTRLSKYTLESIAVHSCVNVNELEVFLRQLLSPLGWYSLVQHQSFEMGGWFDSMCKKSVHTNKTISIKVYASSVRPFTYVNPYEEARSRSRSMMYVDHILWTTLCDQ